MAKPKKLTDMLKNEVINSVKVFKKSCKPSLVDLFICGSFAVAINLIGLSSPEAKESLAELNKIGYSAAGSYAIVSSIYTVTSAFIYTSLALPVKCVINSYKHRTQNLEYNNQKVEAEFRKELVLGEDDNNKILTEE